MNTQSKKTADLKMGKENEDKLLPLLRRKFGKDIRRTQNQFDTSDFINDLGHKWENKSRRIRSDKYATGFMPSHKVVCCPKLVFCWTYLDGQKYLEYDEQLFNTFEKSTLKIWRDGKYDPPQEIFNVPVSLMKNMEDLPDLVESIIT
jgi:hypothetical protein